jgi:hypothetical protein
MIDREHDLPITRQAEVLSKRPPQVAAYFSSRMDVKSTVGPKPTTSSV